MIEAQEVLILMIFRWTIKNDFPQKRTDLKLNHREYPTNRPTCRNRYAFVGFLTQITSPILNDRESPELLMSRILCVVELRIYLNCMMKYNTASE